MIRLETETGVGITLETELLEKLYRIGELTLETELLEKPHRIEEITLETELLEKLHRIEELAVTLTEVMDEMENLETLRNKLSKERDTLHQEVIYGY